MPEYRIKDWDIHFENSASRKLKRLEWVAVPNKMDGEGYTALVEHPHGAAHLGAWYAIVEIASRQKTRGTLPAGVGGFCRCLGRISRLPAEIFEEVIPRLIEIGWLEQVQSNQQSASTSAENPTTAAEGGGLAGLQGIEQNRSEWKRNTVRASLPDRFHDWLDGYHGRKAKPNDACQAWLSRVNSEADVLAIFAVRDRYNASEEVSRGVLIEAANFINQQADNRWAGQWPPAKANGAQTLHPSMRKLAEEMSKPCPITKTK